MSPFAGLTWLHPEALVLGLLLPLALLLRRRRGPGAIRFAPGAFLEPALPVSWRARLLWLPRALQVLGLAAAIVALARPVRRDPLPPRIEGIEILLCLDTSSSMAATDLDAKLTRLDAAKAAAAAFVAARPADRLGLITFARYPDLRCPSTLDHAALRSILDAVALVERDGPEDATGIGTAVALAAQTLRKREGRSRIVILLTDGEENVATAQTPEEIAPAHAAQLCREAGVRVYAIAAGAEGGAAAPAPDTGQVRRLAERTGGRFFEARDARALAGVYAGIDRLEKTVLPEPRFRIEEGFLPFLLAALFLLAVSQLLERTVLEVLP